MISGWFAVPPEIGGTVADWVGAVGGTAGTIVASWALILTIKGQKEQRALSDKQSAALLVQTDALRKDLEDRQLAIEAQARSVTATLRMYEPFTLEHLYERRELQGDETVPKEETHVGVLALVSVHVVNPSTKPIYNVTVALPFPVVFSAGYEIEPEITWHPATKVESPSAHDPLYRKEVSAGRPYQNVGFVAPNVLTAHAVPEGGELIFDATVCVGEPGTTFDHKHPRPFIVSFRDDAGRSFSFDESGQLSRTTD